LGWDGALVWNAGTVLFCSSLAAVTKRA